MKTYYFDVALSVPPYEVYTYSFETDSPEQILGFAVKVPIGPKRTTVGWIWNYHTTTDLKKIKPIYALLSQTNVFPSELLKLLQWISDYYFVKPGIVCKAALPSKNISGNTKDKNTILIKPKQDKIQLLNVPHKQKSLVRFIQDLLQYPNYCPKQVRLKRSNTNNEVIKKAIALDLIEIQEFPSWYQELSETGVTPHESNITTLTETQAKIIKEIVTDQFPNQFITHLLFGVTGSGKTQIYIELARIVLEKNKSVLIIVPEIAMTPQLIGHFQTIFKNQIRVLHSRMSDRVRAGTYHELRNGMKAVVIGARSAIFAPIINLGLVIVDEEHETSLKQHDPEPRYHARDCAIIRAKLANCPAILGSATPSIESFYNGLTNKYRMHILPNRVHQTPLPEIQIIDMNLETPREVGRVEILSTELRKEIATRLENCEQIILLRNRRGYGTHIRCGKCQWILGCPNCSVTLTYHRAYDGVLCHLCGYFQKVPEQCENCGSAQIAPRGFGTERVLEVLQNDFPNARILQFDADSVKQKGSHQKILNQFANHQADILVGTKMVARSLDFPNVTLSAILSADSEWIVPDFRSEERALTLFIQTAGRSGRSKHGKVIIQTWDPNHPIFTFLLNHNWEGFVHYCLKSRKNLSFPPYSRLIRFVLSSQNENLAKDTIVSLQKQISLHGFHCSEIAPALIAKKENWYRYSFLVRVHTIAEKKEVIKLADMKYPKNVKKVIDIDPVDFN